MSWFKRKEKEKAPEPPPPQSPAVKSAKVSPVMGGLDAVRHIIAVGSGKGGVGKSTVSLNLALALKRQGYRVGLVDADVYGPSQQHMTRAERPTLSDDEKLIPPEYEGIKLISVAMFSEAGQAQMLRGPMATQLIRQFLGQVSWGDLDYMIIDLPPGTGDIQLSLAQMAPLSGAVLVTTPQEMSLIDVRKAVSLFKTMNIPLLGVVENMSYFICDSCDKKHFIFRRGGGAKLASEFSVPLLAEVPLDPRVAEFADEGKPAMVQLPESEPSKAYAVVAEKLSQHLSLQQKDASGALGYFLLEWK